MSKCIHGLDTDWCTHCKPRPKNILRDSVTVDTANTHSVQAKYDGWCRACSEQIWQGDQIIFSDVEDAFVHEDCYAE